MVHTAKSILKCVCECLLLMFFFFHSTGVTDQLVEAVSLLRERAEKDEPNSLFSLVNDLSKVLCKKISADNLWQLVVFLLEGLLDFTGHSSSGACVVLNQIMKLRGSALSDHVSASVVPTFHLDLTRRCLDYYYIDP